VASTRNCVELFFLAVICLAALTPAGSLLLWVLVLPLCFLFSAILAFASVVENEEKPSLSAFPSLLPARAPLVIKIALVRAEQKQDGE
jgi:hypothetical protein